MDDADPHDLSLDDNLLTPEVNDKLHDAIARHMNATAKKLAQRKLEKIETLRNGEVIVATIGTDLLFAPNDSILRKEADDLLRPYWDLLNQQSYYKLILALHTDNTGSDKYTDNLSEARVNEIYNLITLHSDNEGRLIPYALGASDPAFPNDSQANRAGNRRLEIFIVPNKLLIEMARSRKIQ
ncbi:MAG: OmpA family protein [Muribaculum sp.]|nr:OmpA family protein [Muribaculaceae bacterium]MCM1080594.1 OmpA family protein [Muribaculum sp.]